MSMMNPLAGPSGPGKYSTRTDKLTLGSQSYGDDTAALNTAAPKSKTRGSADEVGGRPSNPVAQTPVTSLYAPSERPDESITTGIALGDGAGPQSLMMQSQFAEKLSDVLSNMIPYDNTGEIEILYQQALSRGM